MPTFPELDLSGRKRSFVVIDTDGTIVPDGTETAADETLAALKRITGRHETRLTSNRRDAGRNERIAMRAGIRYVRGRKPFRALAETLKEENQGGLPIMVIGDRWLTDGLLAMRLEGEFIPVRPIRSSEEPFGTRFAYAMHGMATAIGIRLMRWCRRP